ncbi:MAG TPA: group III truncated hemoglobin [Cyclobacteriaceae bacterium]|nr:group III truncated hemoglobin [Cyclobacteriaceae bacterium]
MEIQPDIITRKDIEFLVNKFYERVQADPLLAPHFSHVNWETHLPIMHSFWASTMLGEQTYRGNPFQKHVNLPIGQEHFAAWLKLFIEVVDENFKGEKADEIKNRAQQIAQLFQYKMNLIKPTL